MANNSASSESAFGAAEMYGKIAKGLMRLKETGLALKVCDKGISKFPNSSNLHIVKSQTLMAQFKDDSKPEILQTAFGHLEKALKIDPQSYLAKILASQICLKGRAYSKAKTLLSDILKAIPDDEKALSMMSIIAKKEKKKAAAQQPAPTPEEKAPEKAVEPAKPEEKKEADLPSVTQAEMIKSAEETAPIDETEPESEQWVIDDKLVIDASDEEDDSRHLEELSAKFTIFSRLDGLYAIFLVDNNGQLYKSINKAKLDENIIPSLVFNLYKVSMTGVRRTGYGSFQRGTLVSPLGTIILVNAFYATLAVVVDNDANLTAVEARIQRYVDEIST